MKYLLLFLIAIVTMFSASQAQSIHIIENKVSIDTLIAEWAYFPLKELTNSLKKHKCSFTVVKPSAKDRSTQIVIKNGDLGGFTVPTFIISHSEEKSKNRRTTLCRIDITISRKDFDYKNLDSLATHPFCTLYKWGLKKHYSAPSERNAKDFCQSSYEEQLESTKEILNYNEYESDKPSISALWTVFDSNSYGSFNNSFGIKIDEKDFLSFHHFLLNSEKY